MKKSPFIIPGLRNYSDSEIKSFFGREEAIENALEILKKNKILIINGDEASGKTSLINAGILNRIKSNFSGKHGKDWNICKIRPGISPINNLARALSEKGSLQLNEKPKASDFDLYKNELNKKSALGLIEIWKNSAIFEKKNLVIVIDQLEDLFSFPKLFNSDSSDEDNLLLNLIYKTVKNNSCSVYFILAIQSDHFTKLNMYGKFSELNTVGQFNIPSIETISVLKNLNKNLNISVPNELLNKIRENTHEYSYYLANIQMLVKKFQENNFKEEKNKFEEFIKDFNLENVINDELELYVSKLKNDEQKLIDLILRSFIHSDNNDDKKYYQRFEYIKSYCNISSKKLTNLILNINSNFGNIFEIIPENISSIKSTTDYEISDGDCINLKYSRSLNWTRLKRIEKDENFIFNLLSELQLALAKNQSIEIEILRKGIELMSMDYINENWSKKYNLNFKEINELLKSKSDKYENDRKNNIEKNRIKLRDDRRRWWFVFSLIVLLISSTSFFMYKHYQKIIKEEKIINLEKEKSKLIRGLDSIAKKNDSLNINLEDELERIKIGNEIIKNKKDSIEIISKIIFDDSIKIRQQRLDLDKNLALLEKANIEIELKKQFIDLTKREINLNNEIRNLATETSLLNVQDKRQAILFGKKSLKLYEDFKFISEEKKNLSNQNQESSSKIKDLILISGQNDKNSLRGLANNIIAKINGVNFINEVKSLNLLEGINDSKQNGLNSLIVSDDNRIFAAGEAGKIFYSNEINENLYNVSFSEFRLNREISSIVNLNSDVLAVGLKSGEIWYLSIKENIKTRIFPKTKSKEMFPIKDLIFNGTSIFSIQKNYVIEFSLKEQIFYNYNLNIKDDDHFEDIAFDQNNIIYVSTKKGDIFKFNIDDKSNTLIFESNNEVLSFNDRVTKIEYFKNKFIFSTKNGWIYIFDDNNNILEYQNRILAHNSEIVTLFFDYELNRLISGANNGTISINEINSLTHNNKPSIIIDLGANNIITDIDGYKINGNEYILTVDNKGNLSYWNMSLEDKFDYIKEITENQN